MFNRSARSSSGTHLGGAHQDEFEKRDASFTVSGRRQKFNSRDSTTDKTKLFPRDDSDGGLYMGRSKHAAGE
uniref:Uncharacterized protein n=1 Tax=Arundo donax TaxID=35708 RepID=A0A0A9CRH8_ARUDO